VTFGLGQEQCSAIMDSYRIKPMRHYGYKVSIIKGPTVQTLISLSTHPSK